MRKREKSIYVYLNEKEFEHLHRQMEITGLSCSALVRSLIMGSNIRPRPPAEYKALLKELSAIGNNLNQITRIANYDKKVPAETIEKVGTMQKDIWRKVKRL